MGGSMKAKTPIPEPMVYRYQTVREDNPTTADSRVNALIRQGWEVFGFAAGGTERNIWSFYSLRTLEPANTNQW